MLQMLERNTHLQATYKLFIYVVCKMSISFIICTLHVCSSARIEEKNGMVVIIEDAFKETNQGTYINSPSLIGLDNNSIRKLI